MLGWSKLRICSKQNQCLLNLQLWKRKKSVGKEKNLFDIIQQQNNDKKKPQVFLSDS